MRRTASAPWRVTRGQRDLGGDFHNDEITAARSLNTASHPEFLRKVLPVRVFGKVAFRICTKTGHTLVDELHSIDFTADRLAHLLLTAKTARVKRQSFFDSF
jgi:hypothetical protein